MNNIEDLQEVTFSLHNYKPVKKIKVTKEFAVALMKNAKFEDKPKPSYSGGTIGHFTGIPIEIDDEIDGLYEFVY